MTFIYDDKNLIERLLQAGEEFEKKFSKKGQVAPAPQAAQAPATQQATPAKNSGQLAPVEDFDAQEANEQKKNNLRALLFNLRDQLPNAPGSGSGKSGYSANNTLNSQNMDSMGDFVEWLDATHRVDIITKVSPDRSNQPEPKKNWWFCKIEPGTEIVTPLQVPDRSEVAYWINPTTLKQYLISLQGDKDLKSVPLFQVQLLKLIQDANSQLRLGISEQYKEPEKQIDDKQEIDRLPRILDPQHPLAKGNEVQLFYKDIKSSGAFHSWLGQTKISVKVNEKTTAAIGDEDFNQCAVINILYQRATQLSSLSTDESKDWSAAYLKQIAVVAQQVGCRLANQPRQQGQGQGQGGRISPQALQQLSTLKPFNRQNVDFQQIELFLDKYSELANKPAIDNLVTQVKTSIGEANKVLNSPGAPLPMNNLTPGQVKLWSRSPLPLMNFLYTIVSVAGRVYQDFYNEFKNALETSAPTLVASVQEQIAAGGPQQTNIGTILRVKGGLESESRI